MDNETQSGVDEENEGSTASEDTSETPEKEEGEAE